MKVLSVNIGRTKTIVVGGKSVQTGIYKSSTEKTIRLNKLNLSGDEQADKGVHGGLWKAVYIYPSEHYAKWESKFPNMNLVYGAFGENITSAGLIENEIFVGDILQMGSGILSVTEPRQPCFKLIHKLKEKNAGKFMLEHLITGFYLKVIEEGSIKSDSEIRIIERGIGDVSISELTDFLVFNKVKNGKLKCLLSTDYVSPSIKEKIKKSF